MKPEDIKKIIVLVFTINCRYHIKVRTYQFYIYGNDTSQIQPHGDI